MARPTLLVRPDNIPADVLGPAVQAILAELKVAGEFPADVVENAREQAKAPSTEGHQDLTDIEFVTIDPPGSKDLDQAMHLSREGDLYRVHYAIADVPAFVQPGSATDAEARRRGQTIYTPTGRFGLYPPELSEGAASLLPDQVSPAFVWTIDVDLQGEVRSGTVVRAMVRSREQLTYEGVQQAFDSGNPPAAVAVLSELGPLLMGAERARGGAALNIPDQEVVPAADGDGYQLQYRPPRPVEDWNAQISLLTGRVAADIMIAGKVGILRTMPDPDGQTLEQFRRRSAALAHTWPAEQPYGEFLRSLDPKDPKALALLHASARLFRGAGYTPFDGEVPADVRQAAVADEYAHVTAPLRRLVDRFGLVICEALSAGHDVPDWVREALPELPAIMSESDHLAGAVERAGVDLAEALLLSNRVGQTFEGVVVDAGKSGNGVKGLVQLTEPAVLAQVQSAAPLELGGTVSVRLAGVDVVKRSVQFELIN